MVSITEAFERPVPSGAVDYIRTKTQQKGGTATENAHAPKFGVAVSYERWDHYANVALRKTDLREHRLASWERMRLLSLEGDVKDAASPQLINPVELALDAAYPESNIRIIDRNEPTAGTARADKVWYWTAKTNGAWSPLTAFAVMEYKKPGLIDPAEFQYATMPSTDEANVFAAFNQPNETFFQQQSKVLLQQAVHYGDQYRTKYVALFDWDHLVLLHLDQRGPRMDGGNWCFMTVLRRREVMRRALLGFLMRALESSLAGGRERPGFFPESPQPSSTGRGRDGDDKGKGRDSRSGGSGSNTRSKSGVRGLLHK